MNDSAWQIDDFDLAPGQEASAAFLLEKSAEHRRRMDTLREFLLTDGHYGTGATPSEEIHAEAPMRVLRLLDENGEPFSGPPMVFVSAPVSRYFILDLIPGRSFAAHIASSGFDTYIIDFGEPADEDRFADLEWYIDGLMRRAFRAVKGAAGTESVDVIGYCLGGTFALLYTALHPADVRRLSVLTALVDTTVDGGIAWMASRLGAEAESYENPRIVPAATVKSWFEALAPGKNSQESRVSDLLNQLDLPVEKLHAIRTMATWVDDVVPVSGRLLAEIAAKFGPSANELMTGRTTIGSKTVDLSAIDMPVFSVSAARDHISPADGCDAIVEVVPHARVLRVPGGHVGIVAGSRAAELWQTVAEFHLEPETEPEAAADPEAEGSSPRAAAEHAAARPPRTPHSVRDERNRS